MSEERFTVMKKFDGSYVICDKGKMLVADDCCDLLNELNNDFEELGISIKLFEDDIATKDKKIDEQQDTIRKLRNENIISKNKIEDLRTSLFMLNKELERQIQRSCLDE